MARRATAVKEEPVDEIQKLRYELAAQNKRIEALEASRPGRKAKPLIALRQDGVCAVNPEIDSTTCEDSSIFRYQQGCHGTACKAKQHAAYERRKTAKAEAAAPVQKPKRRTVATKDPVAAKAPKTNGKAPSKRAPRRFAAVATAS
jgi:hypothetical protein